MLETALINALIITFLHVCFWEGMILSFIPSMLYNAPKWMKKPLFGCLTCMSVFYSIVLFTIYYFTHISRLPFISMLFTIMITGGINSIIDVFFNQKKNASSGNSF